MAESSFLFLIVLALGLGDRQGVVSGQPRPGTQALLFLLASPGSEEGVWSPGECKGQSTERPRFQSLGLCQ